MPSRTLNPQPLKNEWIPSSGGVGYSKEILGVPTIFRRHCHTQMRRVITFQRLGEHGTEVIRIGCWSYICPVCQCREIVESYP